MVNKENNFKFRLSIVVVIVQSLSCVLLLANPVDCCMPDSSVLYYLSEFEFESSQIHVH